jgi:hypothetical protein
MLKFNNRQNVIAVRKLGHGKVFAAVWFKDSITSWGLRTSTKRRGRIARQTVYGALAISCSQRACMDSKGREGVG